jgi:hypothetical protein
VADVPSGLGLTPPPNKKSSSEELLQIKSSHLRTLLNFMFGNVQSDFFACPLGYALDVC